VFGVASDVGVGAGVLVGSSGPAHLPDDDQHGPLDCNDGFGGAATAVDALTLSVVSWLVGCGAAPESLSGTWSNSESFVFLPSQHRIAQATR
jgi:hypothetical protein